MHDFSTIKQAEIHDIGFGLKSGIEVLDAVMGSRKTTRVFEHIQKHAKAHTGRKFLFVSPYLAEVGNPNPDDAEIKRTMREHKLSSDAARAYLIEGRIRREAPAADFQSPSGGKGTKYDSLMHLLQYGDNIATTHALFSMVDQDAIDLIKGHGYELIIDEALEVIQPFTDMKSGDIELLFKSEFVSLEPETSRLVWDISRASYSGDRFHDIKRLCDLDRLYYMNGNIMLWELPPSFLAAFSKVTIVTYLFEGSIMCAWMDIYNIPWHKADLEAWNILSEIDVIRSAAACIEIYEGKHNAIGDERSALSSTWYSRVDEDDRMKQLTDDTRAVFQAYKVPGSRAIWTTYKGSRKDIGDIKCRRSFVSCNVRATNKYRHREVGLYLVNRYPMTTVTRFVAERGGRLDQDKYALSEMIQWIWRLRVRNNPTDYGDRTTRLYIPSSRMRKLLTDWLYQYSDREVVSV